MRAIIYAGLLAAAAAFTMSCKQNSSEQAPPKAPIEDDYSDINIFEVQAKPATETSAEDAAWKTCFEPKTQASQCYIPKYIFKLGEFTVSTDYIHGYSDQITHEEYESLSDEAPYRDEQYWLTNTNYANTIEFNLYSIIKGRVVVSEEDSANVESCRTFRKIAKQNNDINYNGYYYRNSSYSYIPTECVNIECEQDYDASHTAGTLLNDIATIRYYSAEPFIRSGYKNMRASDGCWFATCKNVPAEPLNTFNTKRINMIEGLSFRVSLTQGPATEGVYTFKLTYKDISGETRTATTIPIRLAAK